jgi:hypothetical protein
MALNSRATQDFVPIKEIRDGTILLKDGGLRAIVLANSTNLSLKSSDEQIAIIMQFKNFLNTLDFPVQISVQSRRLDIRSYLLSLENRMKVQTEPLLKLQTKEYIDFIREFTESVNIMTKNFFVVVPYTEVSLKASTNAFGNFFSRKNKNQAKIEAKMDFEEKRSQLEQRISVVQQGLSSCGIKSAQLDTEQIVEVFYQVFNPGELEGKIKIEN